jgi:hypothetical protein
MRILCLRRVLQALLTAGLLVCCAPASASAVRQMDGELRSMVEQDWAQQEKRLGRAVDSPEALLAGLARASKLLDGGCKSWNPSERIAVAASLAELQREGTRAQDLDGAKRLALYQRVRWLTRDGLLRNPDVTGQPLLFMQRNRYICQMLHEYMGYFYDYGNVAPGGGIYVLGATRLLAEDARGPPGPADERQLHHSGAVARCADGLFRVCGTLGEETRLLFAAATVLQLVQRGAGWNELSPAYQWGGGRLRSVSAARWRRGVPVHAARRFCALQQCLGALRKLHAASHGRWWKQHPPALGA